MAQRVGLTALGVVAAAAMLAGCGDSAGSEATTSPSASGGDIAVGAVLFEDPFDTNANRWIESDVVDNKDFRLAFDDGDFHWTLRNPRPMILVPDSQIEKRRDNVAVKATVTYTGDGFVGVTCRNVDDTDSEAQFYEFMVRDGLGVIRKNDLGDRFEELVKVETVALEKNRSYVVEGRCLSTADGSARLALYLDGTKLTETTVSNPLGPGEAGLKAQGRPDGSTTEYRWRDFTIAEARA